MKTLLLLTASLLAITTTASSAATPGFDTLVNYDTAWTCVYDGGRDLTGLKGAINDNYYDVKTLPDGGYICTGGSHMPDSLAGGGTDRFLVKLNANGKIMWKKFYRSGIKGGGGHSVDIAKNGDFLIGGTKYGEPWIARTDTAGNLKWESWLYDTVKQKSSPLSRSATINYLRESSRGTIVCAAGDQYPYNGGSPLQDYAAYLEFDSLGELINYSEWSNITGYEMGGFSIEETKGGNLLLAGNQAVFYLDSLGNAQWKKTYTFQLTGVGSEVNNINRAKVLRDNTPVVMGQAYEGNCWTKYKKLYYDAWWSPIQYESGLNTNWDTAGMQGGDDHLYDFTQLKNGNLVFVGNLAYTGGTQPIWIIVTDSIGKKLLWEKQFSGPLGGGGPMSVCATPDNGFTVVGYMDNGTLATGYDAFAAHFVPRPVAAISRANSASKSTNDFNVYISRSRLVVSRNASTKTMGEVSVFDISGRCVATNAGNKEIVFDISKLSFGTYFVRVKSVACVQTMKICLDH